MPRRHVTVFAPSSVLDVAPAAIERFKRSRKINPQNVNVQRIGSHARMISFDTDKSYEDMRSVIVRIFGANAQPTNRYGDDNPTFTET